MSGSEPRRSWIASAMNAVPGDEMQVDRGGIRVEFIEPSGDADVVPDG